MQNDSMEISEYVPLRDVVFKSLRESIITGRLEPGQRLMEIQLSQEMGVSRTPVREAIRKLQNEGLVIMHPRKGAVVAPINAKDLQEIMEIRNALERLTCQLSCTRATEADIARLKEIQQTMSAAVLCDDVSKITECDVDFHETITEIAGNSHLTDMLDQIKEHLFRYRLEFIKELDDRNVLVTEHGRILNAIEKGNELEAIGAIENHISRQERYILMRLEKDN